MTWSLVHLYLISQTLFVDPNNSNELSEDQIETVLLVLDFSPSMMLVDAGETGEATKTAKICFLREVVVALRLSADGGLFPGGISSGPVRHRGSIP
jgi:hypothetical protein